jgi:hypothetical protein
MKREIVLAGFIAFSALAMVFFTGALWIFLHTCYFSSDRTENCPGDPRWRIFDCNSRQATDNELYTVSDIPSLRNAPEIADRRLRFFFTPDIKASSWEVKLQSHGKTVYKGPYPEIPFSENVSMDTYLFLPQGVNLPWPIEVKIGFAPKELYRKAGLMRPNDYEKYTSTVPFNFKRPHSIDEWVGLAPDDPEILAARKIIGDSVNVKLPTVARIEQVYRFVMKKLGKSWGGIPSNAVQAASPLETFDLLASGKGKGWCENCCLGYYIFANAAGIRTRLVDCEGKFGALKLTGHYFCESWIPEEAKWCYVDPMMRVANVRNPKGMHLSTLELKRLHDLGAVAGCLYREYNPETGELEDKVAEDASLSPEYFKGDVAFGYKFGYGNNKSMSKIRNFIRHTTLVYAPFQVPKLYRYKYVCLWGFPASLVLAGFCVIALLAGRRRR